MIRPGPILLKTHLKGLFEELDKSDAIIEAQREFQKAAIDASVENHGTDPAAIRQMKARRKKMAKDPAQVSRADELYDQYKFMMEGGISPPVVPSPSDELGRVMALTNTTKPPKIEAIRKALGCSQGKAHKLRSLAAARLATKSSSSFAPREHEHLKPEGGDDGEDPVPATGEIKEEGSLSGRDAGGVPLGRVSSSDEQETPAAPLAESGPCGDVGNERRTGPVSSLSAGVAPGPQDHIEDRGEPAEPLGASGSQMVCGLTNGTPAASMPAEPTKSLYQRITGAFEDMPKRVTDDDLTIPPFLRRVSA